MNQTQEAGAGDGSLQDITQGDYGAAPRQSAKLKEDKGPALGSDPLSYNLYDLVERDKENGKLKCCSAMQKLTWVCSTVCFLGAVAVSFLLSLKPEYTHSTVNSYISPDPLPQKEIDIHDLGLNYLLYLGQSKGSNKLKIKAAKASSGGSGRTLNTIAFDNVDDLKDNAGDDAMSDADFSQALCNGIRMALRQDTKDETTIFLPACRVIKLKSTKKEMNQRILVVNTFEKYKTVKLKKADADTDKLKIADLLALSKVDQTKMTFKNDQETSQSLLILHDSTSLKDVTPYKQYIFSSEHAHHKIEPQVKLDKYQKEMTSSQNNDDSQKKVVDIIMKMKDLPKDTVSDFEYTDIEEVINLSNIVFQLRSS